MGLRFSILGFSQEKVLDVKATHNAKDIKLDMIDLLLMNHISDFPNRKYVMKIIEGDKIFFWMSYTSIIEELPILNLKKQALRDRFDKLVALGVLEKTTNKTNNMTFFRLTDLYENLKYGSVIYDTERGCVVNDGGVYSDTQGVCSPLHTNNIIDKYNNISKEKDSKEKEIVCDVVPMPSPAEHTITYSASDVEAANKQMAGFFEDLWLMYERKGSKANAKKEFAKLTAEEIEQMRQHIPAYLQSRPDRQYRQDFERYIKNKTFNSVVYGRQNTVLYDPDTANASLSQEKPQEFAKSTESLTINGITYR